MAETCFVFGCRVAKGDMVSFHVLPKDLKIREKWVQFIWKNRNIPDKLPEKAVVCSSHFPEQCFENFTQKKMGFAKKFILKPDAVPSIHPADTATTSQHVGQPEAIKAGYASALGLREVPIQTVQDPGVKSEHGTSDNFSRFLPAVRHVACQTDPPAIRSVGTQLSMQTLQNHIRSKGIQAKIPTRDCGVCTLTFPLDSPLLFLQPTIVRRAPKRPRFSLTDEEEDPSECTLSMVVDEPEDST